MKLLNTSFIIQEFVPPETYKKYGEKSVWFINPNIVLFLQWIKDNYNGAIVTVNNWYWGGDRKYSGYRPPDCPIGADESAHKRSDGVDFIVEGYSPVVIRKLIKDNFKLLNKMFGLTGYEKGTKTWTHGDFRWTNSNVLNEIRYYHKLNRK